ncbi:hypothetical protein QBC47DRAFT_426430 [Echria macrotheca]|uniref:Kelch repeat protein n=1 Tax=Echria macrotheca TaxID=438768 RepID=A0AAJ0B4D8_9PEZI|nr:hypothetical protein QBC47DRAFT_426430 [Echria macrotheca]
MAFKACLALAALARAVDALSDAPSPDNFVRRGTTAAAVLGNYVYVDGGEISQYENGKIGNPASVTVNSTLSIDMSKSWTAGTVTIRTIPKTGPRKTNVQVWADPDTNSFYSWGGKWIGGVNMTKTELWKFTADGSGGGAWSVQDPANPNVFGGLIPGEFSAYTTAKGSGFLIGGIASGWTEIYRAKTQTIPGMLTFNIKSKVWENGTFSAGFSPFDTLSGASAQYVPTFGPNGLILVFGGWSPRVDAEPDIKVSPVFDLQNITFFDPETKKKYSQVTTGDVPPSPRGRFCTVGFEREGGYDIFLFGGMNQRAQTNFDDAYILSLPGFVWTKMPQNPAGNRAEHSCVAVGNRQVLSIGGTDMSWTKNDPAKQGLLLFDMTAMKWSDSYDAGAAAYEAPDTIKSWYTKK